MEVQVVPVIPHEYVPSGIPIDVVYETIGYERDPIIINMLMHDIIEYEEETLFLINYPSHGDMESNYLLSPYIGYDITGSMSEKVLSTLTMIYKQDWKFVEGTLENVHFHILTYNGKYVGHVYSWPSSELNVQGIRTSIWNVLARCMGMGVKDVGIYLINSTIQYARYIHIDNVQVHHPYQVMIVILKRYGFSKCETMGLDYCFNTNNTPMINITPYSLVII